MNNHRNKKYRPARVSFAMRLSGIILSLVIMSALVVSCNGKSEKSIDVDTFLKRSHPDNPYTSVTIEGIVSFDRAMAEDQVRSVLSDLYLKYIQVHFSAENKLGKFRGDIFPGSNHEVVLFVYGDDIREDDDYFRFQQFCTQWAYYYKIKCDSLKIVNKDNQPYYFTGISDFLEAHITKYEGADELARQNHIVKIMVDLFRFDKLGKNHTHKFVRFQ